MVPSHWSMPPVLLRMTSEVKICTYASKYIITARIHDFIAAHIHVCIRESVLQICMCMCACNPCLSLWMIHYSCTRVVTVLVLLQCALIPIIAA